MTTTTAIRTVREIMTGEVLTVRDTMSAGELARFLSEREISGAPVVDAEGRLVGVVSTFDLARLAAEKVDWSGESRQSFYRTTPLDDEVMVELYGLSEMSEVAPEGAETLVRDFMSTVIQSIDVATPVPEVARVMLGGHYHRLLVTRDGALAGIVSSMDLLALLAEDGGEA